MPGTGGRLGLLAEACVAGRRGQEGLQKQAAADKARIRELVAGREDAQLAVRCPGPLSGTPFPFHGRAVGGVR